MSIEPATTPADDLGPRIQIFGPRRREGVAAIILAVLFLGSGAAIVFLAWAHVFMERPDWMPPPPRTFGDSVAVAALAAFFIALGAFLVYLASEIMSQEVDFRQDGILVRKGRKTVRLLWAYLALIRVQRVRASNKVKTIGYALITKQGKECYLSHNYLRDFDRLGQLLAEHSRKNRIPWEMGGE